MSVGLLILGHNEFAKGLVSALEQLSGRQEGLCALDYSFQEGEEAFLARLKENLGALGTAKNLALVDLAGSVPYKLASLALEGKGAIVAGVNLGMLLEINEMRHYVDDLALLVKKAMLVGKEQIICYPKLEEEEI